MKKTILAACAAIVFVSLLACRTSPQPGGAPASAAYWTGNGGRGASIAVFNMSSSELSAEDQGISLKVRSTLVEAFGRFSAMDVMDMVLLEQLIMDGESDFYADENEIIREGREVPSRYQLRGNIQRTPAGFNVQINVVQASNAQKRAAFTDTFSIDQIEDLSGIRRASSSLLEQMGVNLTPAGQDALTRPVSANQIHAHNAQILGIMAQRGGNEIAALAHFMQAAHFDPALVEAASRLNILEARISGESGDLGADIRSDMDRRDQWVRRLRETEEFLLSHMQNPPFFLVYSTEIEHVTTDFRAGTVYLRTHASMIHDADHFIVANRVMRTVRNGLIATGRAGDWGLANWPEPQPTGPRVQGLFNLPPLRVVRYERAEVEIELLNADGQRLGRSAVVLRPGWWRPEVRGWQMLGRPTYEVLSYRVMPLYTLSQPLSFPNVDPNLIISPLSIRINSIDGIPVETASQQRRISIMTEAEYNSIASVQRHGLDIPNLSRFGEERRSSGRGGGPTIHGGRYVQRHTTFSSGGTGNSRHYRVVDTLSALVIPYGWGGVNFPQFSALFLPNVTEVVIPENIYTVDLTFLCSLIDIRNFNSITLPADRIIFYRGARRSPFYTLANFYERNGRRAGVYYLGRRGWNFRQL